MSTTVNIPKESASDNHSTKCIKDTCKCIDETCMGTGGCFCVVVCYSFFIILAIAAVLLCVLALTFLAVLIIDVFSYLVTHGEFGCTAFWFCSD